MEKQRLPDVINMVGSNYFYSLEKVGMENIKIPIQLKKKGSLTSLVKADIDVFVNLINPKSKGIHMSRLYLLLDDVFKKNELNFKTIFTLHKKLCQSQNMNSNKSFINIKMEYPFLRRSLVSKYQSYRYYPVTINSVYEEKKKLSLEFEANILYSSTCPCSTILSNQVIQNELLAELKSSAKQIDYSHLVHKIKNFNFLKATPHAQRSNAKVKFSLNQPNFNLQNIEKIIDEIEKELKTPVQGIVKRVDEQEFAKLNSQNLMFCEDACRIIKHYFEKKGKKFYNYSIKVSHWESLHAHDVVAFSKKKHIN